MKKKISLLLSLIVMIFFASCSSQKDLMYFQYDKNAKDYKYTYNDTTTYNYSPNYKLDERDALYVQIKSSIDEASNKVLSGDSYNTSNSMNSESGIYLNSYVIDSAGEITLPAIGKVMVKGLTVSQAQEKIEKKASEWVINPVVICKMVNFKVTILGDVNRPGTYTFYKDDVNVFDVIAVAGDLTYYGNRKEVKIVRKTLKEDIVLSLDLRDASILQNPNYYLQPGDIVYVSPNKATKGLYTFSIPLATITSSMSLLATIVTLILAVKK